MNVRVQVQYCSVRQTEDCYIALFWSETDVKTFFSLPLSLSHTHTHTLTHARNHVSPMFMCLSPCLCSCELTLNKNNDYLHFFGLRTEQNKILRKPDGHHASLCIQPFYSRLSPFQQETRGLWRCLLKWIYSQILFLWSPTDKLTLF